MRGVDTNYPPDPATILTPMSSTALVKRQPWSLSLFGGPLEGWYDRHTNVLGRQFVGAFVWHDGVIRQALYDLVKEDAVTRIAYGTFTGVREFWSDL